MKLRLVVVGIEGDVNLGYLLRLAENFDVSEIFLVRPTASIQSSTRWAARASVKASELVVVPTLDDALRGAELSICTSDEYSAKDMLRTAVNPETAANLAAQREGVVALVVGRESVGLTRDELSKCDLLCTIPASPRYPALNLSNATAILLYEFYKASRSPSVEQPPDRKTLDLVASYARALAEALSMDGRNTEATQTALRKLASRANRAEAEAALRLLSKACARLGCKGRAEELLRRGRADYSK